MEAHSKEIRRNILGAAAASEQTKSLAMQFDVSESWVRRVKQEPREGKLGPATKQVRTPKWAQHKDEFLKLQAEQLDLTS